MKWEKRRLIEFYIYDFMRGEKYAHFKGARYLLIIHELLVAMGVFFSAGVQDKTLKEESQRLAS